MSLRHRQYRGMHSVARWNLHSVTTWICIYSSEVLFRLLQCAPMKSRLDAVNPHCTRRRQWMGWIRRSIMPTYNTESQSGWRALSTNGAEQYAESQEMRAIWLEYRAQSASRRVVLRPLTTSPTNVDHTRRGFLTTAVLIDSRRKLSHRDANIRVDDATSDVRLTCVYTCLTCADCLFCSPV